MYMYSTRVVSTMTEPVARDLITVSVYLTTKATSKPPKAVSRMMVSESGVASCRAAHSWSGWFLPAPRPAKPDPGPEPPIVQPCENSVARGRAGGSGAHGKRSAVEHHGEEGELHVAVPDREVATLALALEHALEVHASKARKGHLPQHGGEAEKPHRRAARLGAGVRELRDRSRGRQQLVSVGQAAAARAAASGGWAARHWGGRACSALALAAACCLLKSATITCARQQWQ